MISVYKTKSDKIQANTEYYVKGITWGVIFGGKVDLGRTLDSQNPSGKP